MKKPADKKAKKPASKKIKGGADDSDDGADGADGNSDSIEDVNKNKEYIDFIKQLANGVNYSPDNNIRMNEQFYENLENSYIQNMTSDENFKRMTAIALRTLVMQHIFTEIKSNEEIGSLTHDMNTAGGATKKPNPKPKALKPKVPKALKPKVPKAK